MPDFVKRLSNIKKYRRTVFVIFEISVYLVGNSMNLLYCRVFFQKAELVCRY